MATQLLGTDFSLENTIAKLDEHLPSRWPDFLTLIFGFIAIVLAIPRMHTTGDTDLLQFYVAGRALVHGQPIYAGPGFPYPPFAAIASAPLAFTSYADAVKIYAVVQVIVPTLGVGLTGLLFSRRFRFPLVALFMVLFLKADVFTDSLFLHNPTLLFVVPLTLFLLLIKRERWGLACAILGVSIAVKPLLVLLLIIPLIVRRRQGFAVGIATSVLLTLVGLVFSHDLSGFERLPQQLADGTVLHGMFQTANVALSSVAVVHSSLVIPVLLARIALIAATAWLLLATFRRVKSENASLVPLSGALALLLPVVGSISEVHYGVLAIPPTLWILFAGHWPEQSLAGLSLLVLSTPLFNLGIHASILGEFGQARWALGQTLALVACLAAGLLRPSSRQLGGL